MTEPAATGDGVVRRAIARPVTVLVGILLLMLFGTLSIFRLPIQLTPDILIPTLTVKTQWPGAAPTEIEMEILEEQEEALKSVPGLVKMKSQARSDEGEITLEFAVGTSLEEALVRVSNRLTQVPEYPEAAREPVVATSDTTGPPLAVTTIRSLDGRDIAGYRTWVEQVIIPKLERIRGVPTVLLLGGRNKEIHVDFDPAALASRGLTVGTVARKISAELVDVSGGDMTLGKRRYLVRTPIAPEVPEHLERLVLGATVDGTPVLLADVATVKVGLRKRTALAMQNQQEGMVMLMWREAGTNVLEVTEELRSVVDDLQQTYFAPEGLEMAVISDQTGYIYGALDLVRQNLLLGGALAVLVLLLFLRSLSAALLIAIAIPVCVVGTALGMDMLGRSVNVVSLAGTAFAVGMVVDAAIVVLESIDTARRRGTSPREAADQGARLVWGAILASTLTTVAVFLPIIAWQDEVGELLRDVAIAISLAVSLSLLVSVLAIPSFSARLLRTLPQSAGHGERTFGARFRRGVGRQVRFLTRRPLRALGAVVLGVGGSIAVAVMLLPPMEYLPTGNRNLVFGILTPPPGYSVEEIQRTGRFVQAKVAEHTGVEKDGVPAIERSFFVGDPNRVFMGAIAESPDADQLQGVLQFYRDVQAEIPAMFAIATQASLFSTSIGASRAVEIELASPDLEGMVGLGGRMMGMLKTQMPGAQIRPIPSLDLGAPEIRAVPRRDEAAALRMDGAELGLVVDAMVDGAIVGELGREGERKIDVVLRATRRSGDPIDSPDALRTAPVATPSGDIVPLSTLASLEEQLGPTVVQRIERSRAITLQVSPPEDTALEDAMDLIRDDIIAPLRAEDAIPPGLDVTLSGTAGKLEGAQARLGAVLLLAIVISFLLLAALFEDFLAPIAVLVTVPLAAAGGLLGLFVVDRLLGAQALDMMTAMGFIILIGVVVNNAILVVDGALTRLRAGDPLANAVPDAVEARVRPIFMSSLTSLAGLLPLVLFPGSGSELYRGIGSVVLGGLALSTVLTLYVTPSLFSLLWRLRGAR